MSKMKFKKTFEELYNNIVEDTVSFIYNSKTKYESKQQMLTDVKNYLEVDQKKQKIILKIKKTIDG